MPVSSANSTVLLKPASSQPRVDDRPTMSGRLTGNYHYTSNGNANGNGDGSASPSAMINNKLVHHHHQPCTLRSHRSSRKPFVAWTLNKALKLAVWYTLITLALRCPSSLVDLQSDSPRICRPYLQSRDFVAPYARPLYDRYLSSYRQQAQPYLDQLNERLYTPGYALYQKLAAPRLASAQNYAYEQWERTARPQLKVLQKEAGERYGALLGPHVQRAQDVVRPYYDTARNSANRLWTRQLGPAYRTTKPIAEKFCRHGQQYAVRTALPHAQYVASSVWAFWTLQAWPRLRILYGENVEPQLLRITERLGRYKDGKKLEADMKGIETATNLAEAMMSPTSVASLVSSTVQKLAQTASAAPRTGDSEQASNTNPAIRFKEDLGSWEQLCAQAVEEGSDDLTERIQELTDTQIENAHGVGNALITQLDQAVDRALLKVKARIQQTIHSLPEQLDAEPLEHAHKELVLTVRAAGQNIKHRAQAVRNWRQTQEAETSDLVSKAFQSTVETINHIRDLRLTEIGRKYTSLSLPHKEWSKYNDLKKDTHTWQKDVERAARRHDGIKKAQDVYQDIEQQAMAIAEDAAKELSRLKEVGKWKIATRDSSDDFSTRHNPLLSQKAKEIVVDKIAEASHHVFAKSSVRDDIESAAAVAAGKVIEPASSVSGAEDGSSAGAMKGFATEQAPSLAEKMTGSTTGFVESAASSVYENVVIPKQPAGIDRVLDRLVSGSDAAHSAPSAGSRSSSSIPDIGASAEFKANPIVDGTERPVPKSFESKLPNSGSSFLKKAPDSSPAASKIAASAASAGNTASSYASSVRTAASGSIRKSEGVKDAASKPQKVFAGAMAQVLTEVREPILDDHFVAAEQPIGIGEPAKAVEDAVNKATSNQGPIEDVANLAGERYEKAIFAASNVLYDTRSIAEPGENNAKERYESAVVAASYAIYGTPFVASPVAHASSVYEHAVSQAAKTYDQVKSRLSAQISSTPAPAHQQILSSAESVYAAASSAASERLRAAIGAATQNPYESISSVAASRLSEAVATASAQYKNAKIAAGVESPLSQKYLASAQRAYYEALGVAHGRFSEFLDAASSIFSPQPTSTGASKHLESAIFAARSSYDEYISAAQSRYNMLVSKATAAASPQGDNAGHRNSLDEIQEQLASASSFAASILEAASSEISAAIYVKEPSFTESLSSQASQSWEALVSKASEQVYGAPLPFTDHVASRVTELAVQATEVAAAQWEAVSGLFSELVVGKEPDFTESVYNRLQSAYSTRAPALVSQASIYASEAYETAASKVSAAFIPPTQIPGIIEQAKAQLNAAVDAASAQLYGPSKGAVEQATDAAASAYSGATLQASQAFYGKEDSYLDFAQSSLIEIGASASSALRAAVNWKPTNTVQAASDQAASIYDAVASQVVEQAAAASAAVNSAIYGEEQSYLDRVQSQLSSAVASANSRVSHLVVQASKAAGDTAHHINSAALDAAKNIGSATGTAVSSGDSVKDEL